MVYLRSSIARILSGRVSITGCWKFNRPRREDLRHRAERNHSPRGLPTYEARAWLVFPAVLKDIACPKCEGHHVRLSRPHTPFERFLNLLGMGVHRRHRCFYRYIPFFGRKIVRK